MKKIIVNGRFLGGEDTAVNSVARELTIELHKACTAAGGEWELQVAVPQALRGAPQALGLPALPWGRRSGILWEQTELPALRREGRIVNFFNTLPIWGRGYATLLHDAHVFRTPQSYSLPVRLWRRFLSRRAGAPGNVVLTPSWHSRQQLLAYGVGRGDRVFVVPNGIRGGAQTGGGAILERLGLGAGEPFCLAVSSLMPHKKLPLLLEAFASPALQDLKLVLIGRTGRREYAAAGCAPGDNVLFPGWVDAAELPALYRAAMAVCIPSTEEGFGLPALEAMAHGTLPVVAPHGALPEVVSDVGLVLPENSAGAWAAALSELRRSPPPDPARREALRKQASHFNWAASAEKILDILDRTAGPCPGSAGDPGIEGLSQHE